MRNFVFAVVFGSVVSLGGCPARDSGGGEAAPVKTDAAKPVDAGTPAVAGALAVVDGIPVSRDEFLRYIEPYPDQMKNNPQGRGHVMQSLIDHVLLQEEAARLGLDRDPDYLRKVDNYRRNLLDNLLLEHQSKDGFVVTEEEARKYFDEHPDEFDKPERVQVAHILVKTEADARAVMAKIRAGQPFEKLAREMSQDPASRDRGGEMGLFSAKQRPQLADAAFGLKSPGQISEPFQTSRGFEILKLIKRVPPSKETFAHARAGLINRLRARKRQDTKQKLLARLRGKARIKTNKQALEKLKIPPARK